MQCAGWAGIRHSRPFPSAASLATDRIETATMKEAWERKTGNETLFDANNATRSSSMARRWLARSALSRLQRIHAANVILPVLAAIWLTSSACGLGFLMRYSHNPGDSGRIAGTWPKGTGLERSSTKPTLLVFAHPKCPCTSATMHELSWLMTRCHDLVDCRAIFFKPAEETADWVKTSCWRLASSAQGVRVMLDSDHRYSKRFGVATSGHALLYDAQGKLLFHGGITPSRGHRGASPGRKTLLELIRGGDADASDPATQGTKLDATCVFGCPLEASQRERRQHDLANERG